MTDSSPDSVPADPIDAQLDSEISSLQSQISTLKALRTTQTQTLLTSHTSQTILSRLRTRASKSDASHADTSPLLQTASRHLAHSTTNLYRACASATAFLVHDPDPYARDAGRVLGIRIDTSTGGRFVRAYYVMLNRAGEGWRVHRHTVPACIPLAGLAEKYLGKGEGELGRFVRALRRAIVGWRRRTEVIRALRREFAVGERKRERVIVDISAADAEARQVRIEWVDGRVGRCVVGEDGVVEKCVVIGEQGRDWEVERRILGGDKEDPSMSGIGERLKEGIY